MNAHPSSKHQQPRLPLSSPRVYTAQILNYAILEVLLVILCESVRIRIYIQS